MLLAAGADPELHTATGCCGTALHLAAALGDLRHHTLTCRATVGQDWRTRLVMMGGGQTGVLPAGGGGRPGRGVGRGELRPALPRHQPVRGGRRRRQAGSTHQTIKQQIGPMKALLCLVLRCQAGAGDRAGHRVGPAGLGRVLPAHEVSRGAALTKHFTLQ